MGRKLLPSDAQSTALHPFLSLSLLITGVVATFALTSSLCALRRKHQPNLTSSQKKPKQNSKIETSYRENENPTEETKITKFEPAIPVVVAEGSDGTDKMSPPLPLPPPPGKTNMSGSMSFHNRSKSLVSTRKSFLSSMSMRVQGVGIWSRQKSKILNHEDSILKKKIILGEKCRVPDEEDTVLFDDNGHRISTYHPRTPSSLPVSRQTSFIDPETVHGSVSLREK